MRFFRAIIFLIIFFLQTNMCLALDWKRLHEQADRTEEATALQLVAENPQHPDSLYLLALVYLNEYKTQQSREMFERLLQIAPDTPEAKWGIAETDRRLRKIPESKALLEDVLKKDPDFVPAKVSLAYMQYMAMSFDKAARLCAQVIDQGRDRVDLSNYVRAYGLYAGAKGMIAYYGGPVSKVINGTFVLSTLRNAEKLDPNAPGILFGIGSYYLLAPPFLGRNLDMSETYLMRAIERDPRFPDVYVRLAQVYELKGDAQKYEEYLNKALALDPQNELALDIKKGTCKFVCVGKR